MELSLAGISSASVSSKPPEKPQSTSSQCPYKVQKETVTETVNSLIIFLLQCQHPLLPSPAPLLCTFGHPNKLEISEIEDQILSDQAKISHQREILGHIQSMEKQHGTKVPYEVMHTFDMARIQAYFGRLKRKKEVVEAAVVLQKYVRGWRERKEYRRYMGNKLRLAVKVQQTWKKHYRKIKKRRQEEQEYLDKIVLIQAHFRGFLTRKNWDKMMKDRLNNNEEYFNNLRNIVMIDAARTIQEHWRAVIPRIRKMRVVQKHLARRKRRVIIIKWKKHLAKVKKQKMQKNLYGGYNPTTQDPRKSTVGDILSAARHIKRKRRTREISDSKFLKTSNKANPLETKSSVTSGETAEMAMRKIRSENIAIIENKSDSGSSGEEEESEDEKNNSSPKDREDGSDNSLNSLEEPEIFVSKISEENFESRKGKTFSKGVSGMQKTQNAEAASILHIEEGKDLKSLFSSPLKKSPKSKSKGRVRMRKMRQN